MNMVRGVLVTPTVHGNLLVGPDSESTISREDFSTTTEQLNFVKEKASLSVKKYCF